MVEESSGHGTAGPSTGLAVASDSGPTTTEQAGGQAENVVLALGARRAQPPPEPEEPEVMEEIQGHPQGGGQESQQRVYMSCWRKDHWVTHEEILEDEEADRVEQATKALMEEVKVSFTQSPASCLLFVVVFSLACLLSGGNEDLKVP